jgi:hydroxymethylpyrimidine pyrophosphatase-like HAD family hydrolase
METGDVAVRHDDGRKAKQACGEKAPRAARDGSAPYRLLALDVDGTLLDSDGTLRPSTADAVARAARAGIRPVLCTGRRYRRARPIAEQLGLDAPIVCNSGAVVKEPSGHGTLWRADIDAPLLATILALFREHDEPVLSFTDLDPVAPDFLVERAATGRPLFDDYLHRNRDHAAIVPGWTALCSQGKTHLGGDHQVKSHFHLCGIGTRAAMLRFEQVMQEAVGDRVRTFVQRSPLYAGTMCEVLRYDASKWSGILYLADLWEISADEICAVGDDMNDLPMIKGAGLGVAMGHAPASIRAAADHVTGDHEHDGVAMLVDNVLLVRQ